MSALRNRFYKTVSINSEGLLHRVLLDGKPVKTPGAAALVLPSRALAQAIAEEWQAQETTIRPATMLLTKLANTAIDRVAPNPEKIRQQVLAFARSDVVCYRAGSPADLVRRQDATWNPLLVWLNERYGAELRTASGLAFIEQDRQAIEAIGTALSPLDSFSLAALASAAALCGSLVVGLALFERRLDAEGAFAAANLDRIYQAERWGWDQAETAKAESERVELNQIARVFELLRT